MATGTITRSRTRTGTATKSATRRKAASAIPANGAASINATPITTTFGPASAAGQAGAAMWLRWAKRNVPGLPADFGNVSYAAGRQVRASLAALIDGTFPAMPAAPRARSGTK